MEHHARTWYQGESKERGQPGGSHGKGNKAELSSLSQPPPSWESNWGRWVEQERGHLGGDSLLSLVQRSTPKGGGYQKYKLWDAHGWEARVRGPMRMGGHHGHTWLCLGLPTPLSFFLALQLEINDMTKSWGLEVDRVELSMEAVLQPPRENLVGPLATAPPIAGLEGLDGTIQQLAAHFFSNTLALAGSKTGTPETGNQHRATTSLLGGCPSCPMTFTFVGCLTEESKPGR